jgi:hypothetical protein
LEALVTVVNIEDYRAPVKTGRPCIVNFLGFAFKTPEGVEGRLNFTVRVEDGDAVGVIDAIKEQGGAYLPSQDDGKTFWFLPWPCAAIRISPVDDLAKAQV